MSQQLNEVFAEAPWDKLSLDMQLIKLQPNLQNRNIYLYALITGL